LVEAAMAWPATSAETETALFGGKAAVARLVEAAVMRHSVMVASEPAGAVTTTAGTEYV
jgi:hypothetical protein